MGFISVEKMERINGKSSACWHPHKGAKTPIAVGVEGLFELVSALSKGRNSEAGGTAPSVSEGTALLLLLPILKNRFEESSEAVN